MRHCYRNVQSDGHVYEAILGWTRSWYWLAIRRTTGTRYRRARSVPERGHNTRIIITIGNSIARFLTTIQESCTMCRNPCEGIVRFVVGESVCTKFRAGCVRTSGHRALDEFPSIFPRQTIIRNALSRARINCPAISINIDASMAAVTSAWLRPSTSYRPVTRIRDFDVTPVLGPWHEYVTSTGYRLYRPGSRIRDFTVSAALLLFARFVPCDGWCLKYETRVVYILGLGVFERFHFWIFVEFSNDIRSFYTASNNSIFYAVLNDSMFEYFIQVSWVLLFEYLIHLRIASFQ